MKILFVSSGASCKGPSPIVIAQGNSLILQGIEVNFFLVTQKGIKGYLKASAQLRKILKTKQYDIIHAHYGLCGITALFARRKEKIVVSFMGDDIVGTNKPNGKITLISKIFARINILFAKWFYNYVIVKSPEMLNKAKSVKTIALVPNGVNFERFKVIEKNIALDFTKFNPEKNNIIWVSDPKRTEKNFKLAEEAVQLIQNKNVKLHILKTIANEELPYYYNVADCLLLTSYHEGSPNVVKEAMACNCPVVSTAVGDVKQLLEATEGNFLVDFSKEDIAKKILDAIAFRKNKKYSNGREKLSKMQLDDVAVANKIISIYKKTLSK